MKLAIIGAAGNVGQRLVTEALSRGHKVTAIGPTISKLEQLGHVVAKEGRFGETERLAAALAGHDVIISAVRFVDYQAPQLLEAVRQSGVSRLAVVGGAGSLTAPNGGLVVDGLNFPDAVKPEANAGKLVLDALLEAKDIDWTFLSPSAVFSPGERTGKFRLGKDNLLIGEDGKSQISYEDFAIAMLDEIENPQHSRQRFTVGY